MSVERRQRLSAVYETIPTMPTDICGLIADYAERQPYVWNDDRHRPFATCSTNADGSTTLKGYDAKSLASSWRFFRSETSIGDGRLQWTVELEFNRLVGWIGAGVTVSDKNDVGTNGTSDDCIAGPNDWILNFGNNFNNLAYIRLKHDGSTNQAAHLGDDISGRCRIWFRADPSTGLIQARWQADGLPPSTKQVAWTQAANPDRPMLDAFRPCVVISGPTSAVVRSGGIDDVVSDDDWTDLVAA
jgi:hypothetical protein